LAQPAAPPTTAPANEVGGLIDRLGDPDFRVRREASTRLRQIGPGALPALRNAAESPDPEVRLRAAQIIRSLEHHTLPGRPQRHGRASRVTVMTHDGRRTLDIDDGGRQIRISQGDAGIAMTVTGEVDGRPATESYRASSADELKTRHPEAYALYRRWAIGDADDVAIDPFMIRGNMLIPPIAPLPPGRLFIPPQVIEGGDDLAALRLRLKHEMAQARMTPEQRKLLGIALDRLDDARRLDGTDDPDRHIARYNAASDALRQAIRDAHLADPGDALPPPESARLGISAPGDDGLDGGIRVSHVMPDSRADRVGLQEGDVIRGVNGQPVRTVKDLRRFVTEHPKGVVFEITRDGQNLKLREKAN
jgi:hypothetical protein